MQYHEMSKRMEHSKSHFVMSAEQDATINILQVMEISTCNWKLLAKMKLNRSACAIADNSKVNDSNPGDPRTEELLPAVSFFDNNADSDSAALTSVNCTTKEILNSAHDVSKTQRMRTRCHGTPKKMSSYRTQMF